MNNKGLVVKDKYIKIKALTSAKELNICSFSCFNGYIDKYKERNKFVCRVQTTSRLLHQNEKFSAIDFIESTRNIIKKYNIKDKNIIFNLDQVPRYIEQETDRTLGLKSTRNIKLFKADNSHSRFTYTPVITADRKFLGGKNLFSNLKSLKM
ncbi:hypothetical protein DMUE_0794 [Dictyocoela muelleri]|nr:hypothetical protein DMUE_0794 [Dictyocoela muelleri]